MPRIADITKPPYTLISSLEASKVASVCSYIEDRKKIGQVLAAYWLIATRRDRDTLKASVSDSEIAKDIPRIREGENGKKAGISAESYRKTVKPVLKRLGLVWFEEGRRLAKGGTLPTVYTFPRLKEWNAKSGEPNQPSEGEHRDENASWKPNQANTNAYSEAKPNKQVDLAGSQTKQTSANGWTSRRKEYQEEKSTSTERGNKFIPLEGEACPKCNGEDIARTGSDWVCRSCGRRASEENWYLA